MSLIQKMLDFQKEVKAVEKDSENPFFKSNYFDINKLLDDVKPLLSKLGIWVAQPLSNLDGKPSIRTILTDVETGEKLEDVCPITENPDPQKMGSAITYFRRYALQSILCLQAEDDDANSASNKVIHVEDGYLPKKQCLICKKWHTGQYQKCLECFKSGATPIKTKTIENPDGLPFN